MKRNSEGRTGTSMNGRIIHTNPDLVTPITSIEVELIYKKKQLQLLREFVKKEEAHLKLSIELLTKETRIKLRPIEQEILELDSVILPLLPLPKCGLGF